MIRGVKRPQVGNPDCETLEVIPFSRRAQFTEDAAGLATCSREEEAVYQFCPERRDVGVKAPLDYMTNGISLVREGGDVTPALIIRYVESSLGTLRSRLEMCQLVHHGLNMELVRAAVKTWIDEVILPHQSGFQGVVPRVEGSNDGSVYSEAEYFQDQLQRYRNQNCYLWETNRSLSADCNYLRENYEEVRDELRSNLVLYQRLKEKYKDSCRQLEEMDAMQQRVVELEYDNSVLRKQLTRCQRDALTTSATKAQLEEVNSRLLAEVSSLKSKGAGLLKRQQELESSHQAQIAELCLVLDQSRAEVSRLQEVVNDRLSTSLTVSRSDPCEEVIWGCCKSPPLTTALPSDGLKCSLLDEIVQTVKRGKKKVAKEPSSIPSNSSPFSSGLDQPENVEVVRECIQTSDDREHLRGNNKLFGWLWSIQMAFVDFGRRIKRIWRGQADTSRKKMG